VWEPNFFLVQEIKGIPRGILQKVQHFPIEKEGLSLRQRLLLKVHRQPRHGYYFENVFFLPIAQKYNQQPTKQKG
jgi:uncharacterized membrane protein YjdF